MPHDYIPPPSAADLARDLEADYHFLEGAKGGYTNPAAQGLIRRAAEAERRCDRLREALLYLYESGPATGANESERAALEQARILLRGTPDAPTP